MSTSSKPAWATKRDLFSKKKKRKKAQVEVVFHTCNPSYVGDLISKAK
jgi:hypothetical protein